MLIFVAVRLRTTTQRSLKMKLNCHGHVMVSAAQRQVTHHAPVTAEQARAYVLCSRTNRSVTQWMGEGSPRGQVRLLLCILQGLYTCCAIYLLSYNGAFKSKCYEHCINLFIFVSYTHDHEIVHVMYRHLLVACNHETVHVMCSNTLILACDCEYIVLYIL